MRALRLLWCLPVAFLLGSCENQPTTVDESPQFGATHLGDPSEWEMVQDWFLYEDYVWIPCANGGAGATFWWSGEIAGWGKTHVTPSGNYVQIVKVDFRNVEQRLGSPDGELYPFVKVVQQNVTHQFQQDGRTLFHMPDNEFYTSPDGRNLKVQFLWHLVMGGDGNPAEAVRSVTHCSPARW
jgi:hypothetical protein